MNKSVKSKSVRKISPIFLLALPALVIFDAVLYFSTRSSCLACPQFTEFINNASLTAHLLSNTAHMFRRSAS